MLLNRNLTLFSLTLTDIVRQKFWVSLKIVVLFIWGLIVNSLFLILSLNPMFFSSYIFKEVVLVLVGILTLITFIFLLVSISLTTKLKSVEFGLFRSIGARRSEIFLLILNESLILTLLSSLFLLIVDIFILFHFRINLTYILKTSYDINFFIIFLKTYFFTIVMKFILLFIICLPIGIRYSFLDPYKIIRY